MYCKMVEDNLTYEQRESVRDKTGNAIAYMACLTGGTVNFLGGLSVRVIGDQTNNFHMEGLGEVLMGTSAILGGSALYNYWRAAN